MYWNYCDKVCTDAVDHGAFGDIDKDYVHTSIGALIDLDLFFQKGLRRFSAKNQIHFRNLKITKQF